MKKILLLIVTCLVTFSFVGCNKTRDDDLIFDNLGGGGTASDTDESEINPENAPVHEEIENPDDEKFQVNIDVENAIYLDLEQLDLNNQNYSYEDNVVSINKEGIYVVSGTLNGCLEVSGDPDKVQIILNGATINTLDEQTSAAIVFKKNTGKRILSVYEGTINNLSDSIGDTSDDGDGAIIQAKNSSLTINGKGILNLVSEGEETTGIKVKKDLDIYDSIINITVSDHGIKSGELLSITNASIFVEALGDGIKTDIEASTQEEGNELIKNPYAGYIYICNSNIKVIASDDGISANSYMKINNTIDYEINVTTNNGAPTTITETSSDNADGKAVRVSGITLVDEDNNETDLLSQCQDNYYLLILGGKFVINSNDDAVTSKGNLVICDGDFTIKSGDDAIHAEYVTKITDGNFNIDNCYEGIEGASVEIYGGNIDLVSVDDGINAANADLINWNYNIYIGGGNTVVNAGGDGVDSNGTCEITGGKTIIYGPTNGANGSLDADKGIKVTGGILVALGSSGMVETPAVNSTQCCVVYNMAQSTTSILEVLDSSGNILITVATSKRYQSIVISLPEFVKGNAYTIKTGSSSQSVTLNDTSIITSLGHSFGGYGGANGGKPGGRPW